MICRVVDLMSLDKLVDLDEIQGQDRRQLPSSS